MLYLHIGEEMHVSFLKLVEKEKEEHIIQLIIH
jgi:hypothetical protein